MLIKWMAGALCAVLVAFLLLLAWSLNSYAPLPVDPAWRPLPATGAAEAEVTVRFTGTTTLLISDGETAWMIDGWFSRPGPLQLALGKIAPDMDAITFGLAANEVDALAAVIPMHSHFDHAMDAPEVARRTGAVLMGSPATANIGRGWGLPEDQIRVLQNREPVKLGSFRITPVESRHFQFPDPAIRERALGEPEISEPLVPPVAAFDYRLGKAYVLHVAHPAGNFVVVGSAGFLKDALLGFPADTIFLGLGGLGSQTGQYRHDYWQETVVATGAQRIIPVHMDSLTGPIEGPFLGPARMMAFMAKDAGLTLPFLSSKLEQDPALRIRTLPRYREVILYP
ncbi:MBL fold metallo-hydrolase [Pseudohalioglobus lutimaris]|uniref:MBL fold metallo-hydrolase n=1 Tax=Pseudohalioglobus lutimaris TaxID=1737061 RepID=A0A2N5X6J2_9GAMM|nr:MBL fold metallo-hydrolase [Pseudohalioglobus lutimaris]PLW70113.1 MBL fold metallo-hydrolase [Pseudohalioglobus lutimaris]